MHFQECVRFTSIMWWSRSIITTHKFTNLAPFYVPFIILNKYIQPIQVIPGWLVKNAGFWVRVPVNVGRCHAPGDGNRILYFWSCGVSLYFEGDKRGELTKW